MGCLLNGRARKRRNSRVGNLRRERWAVPSLGCLGDLDVIWMGSFRCGRPMWRQQATKPWAVSDVRGRDHRQSIAR